MSETQTQSNVSIPVAGEGDVIVQITPLAAEKVLEIRKAEEIENELSLRLRVVGGGCAGFSYDLYFDEKTPMDKEFSIHDVHVVVDQMSLMYLLGTTIDYVEGLQGAGFKFNNPNVKATCGCGSSFSV
jgi:iron-sulfur cluster insertion protein